MIKKGIISHISGSLARVILPDEDNAVTAMLPFAKNINVGSVSVGDACVIGFFYGDVVNLADGVIIAVY